MTSVDNSCLSLQGFIWTEIKQMWDSGFQEYIDDWWNLMDFIMNSLYLATIALKFVAHVKVRYMLEWKVFESHGFKIVYTVNTAVSLLN